MPDRVNIEKSFSKLTPCLWAQAGIVRKKQCDIDYQCTECHFDRVMKYAAGKNKERKQAGEILTGKRAQIVSWRDRFNTLPVSKRPCIHHMKGRIEFRSCTNEYRCGNCDFDQFFSDQFSVHAITNPVSVLNISGFRVPQGYYIHKGHTWVRIEEGSSVRVGIDDFVLRLMGPLDKIDAPLMGKKVIREDASIVIKREENMAEMLCPVSGIVMAINPEVREKGNIANKDPYSGGWVMKVQADNLRDDMKHLMISDETDQFIKEQVDMLYDIVEEVSGPLAADGGDFTDDIFGSMPQLGWERLASIFLHT